MDNSKTYRLMCKESKKYLGWKPEPYDLFWDTFGLDIEFGKMFIVGNPEDYDKQFKDDDSYIPVYQQDRLWEMLPQFKGNSATIFNTLDELLVFMRENIYNFDTLEQFLLTFVMKNNYSKSWIDLEWK